MSAEPLPGLSPEFIHKLLLFTTKTDLTDMLYFYSGEETVRPGGIRVAVTCSDTFGWGCSDCEDLTEYNFPDFMIAWTDLKKVSRLDAELYTGDLFAARQRGLRPQDACYHNYSRGIWELFDACGPERPTDMGNPKPRPVAEN